MQNKIKENGMFEFIKNLFSSKSETSEAISEVPVQMPTFTPSLNEDEHGEYNDYDYEEDIEDDEENKEEDDDDFLISAGIGAATGSAIMGGVLGGSFLGGLAGSSLFGDDDDLF